MNVSRKLKRGVVAAIVFNAVMLVLTLVLSKQAIIKHPMVGQLIIDNTGLFLSVRPQAFLFNAQDRANLDEYLSVAAKQYGRINKPVLSIAATKDREVPLQAHHKKLKRQLTNIQSVVLDEAGHLPHHTHSGKVEEEIYRFLQSL